MICRVCDEPMIQKEVVKKCREGHFKIDSNPQQLKIKDILIYECPKCTHLQSEFDMLEDYYEEYVADAAGEKQYYGECRVKQLKIKKLRDYAYSNKSMIEIGCGVGDALKVASRYFEECIGIEPATKLCELVVQSGYKVINGYFDASLKLEKKVSAFMSFQVFEHLDALDTVMKYAYEVLEEGGVGLINVPNGQRIFEEGLYHQIISEHINYFTPLSLAKLVEKHGFRIIEIENDIETVELNIYIKKAQPTTKLNDIRNRQEKILYEKLKEKKKIVIWGAGAKASIYGMLLPSEFYNNEREIHLVDSDPEKVGKYVSGVPLKIQVVSKELITSSDVVVIFASAYNKEIISYLRKELEYRGEIVYFDKNTIKIEQ